MVKGNHYGFGMTCDELIASIYFLYTILPITITIVLGTFILCSISVIRRNIHYNVIIYKQCILTIRLLNYILQDSI